MSQSELILVDQDGVPRIVLTAGREESLIVIKGDKGTGLSMSAGGHQCSLEMSKAHGRMGVLITSNENDVAMQIADSAGVTRLTIHAAVHDLATTITFRSDTGEATRILRLP